MTPQQEFVQSKIDAGLLSKELQRELIRQFGKKDAKMMEVSPHKYSHHFDSETTKAFDALK